MKLRKKQPQPEVISGYDYSDRAARERTADALFRRAKNARTAVVQDVLPDTVHTALVTDTPYARRLYHHPEYHFQTGKNANARGEWLHDWLPGGAQEHWLQTTYESALKRRLPK